MIDKHFSMKKNISFGSNDSVFTKSSLSESLAFVKATNAALVGGVADPNIVYSMEECLEKKLDVLVED